MVFVLTPEQDFMRHKVCLPLDDIQRLHTKDEKEGEKSIESVVRELAPVVGLFKIGFGSYTRFGPAAIQVVHDNGGKVFLDLKYHDIPATVKDASAAAAEHEVYMFNVHASGGLKMMRAAVEGVDNAVKKFGVQRPKIIGVTVLTSFDEARYLETYKPLNPRLRDVDFRKYCDTKKDDEILQQEFRELLKTYGLSSIIQTQVHHLATLSREAGLSGIVCSPQDLSGLRGLLDIDFMAVTPGIQGPTTKAGDDQRRVDTPGNAIYNGSSILVVGRAITDAGNKYSEHEGKKVLVVKGTTEDRLSAGYAILNDMVKYAKIR